jgi:hypothetical protein
MNDHARYNIAANVAQLGAEVIRFGSEYYMITDMQDAVDYIHERKSSYA